MGAPQFGRGIENESFLENLQVDVLNNEANQLDDDFQAEDLSVGDATTGEENISGAQELTIGVTENAGGSADVVVEWTNGAGTVLFQETVLSGVSSGGDYANVIVKSTHVNVKIQGSSTDTDATVNAH